MLRLDKSALAHMAPGWTHLPAGVKTYMVVIAAPATKVSTCVDGTAEALLKEVLLSPTPEIKTSYVPNHN